MAFPCGAVKLVVIMILSLAASKLSHSGGWGGSTKTMSDTFGGNFVVKRLWEEGGGNLVVARLWGRRGDVFVFRG